MRARSAHIATAMAFFLAIGLSAHPAHADCVRALPSSSEVLCSSPATVNIPNRGFNAPVRPGLTWSIEVSYEQEQLPEANGFFVAPLVRRQAAMPTPDPTVHGIPMGPPPQVKAGVRFTYRWSGSTPWR